MRIGIGYDSHRLVKGRKLIIGGVEIPFEKGLLGHSDGDVLCHAITDSIVGALGLGDIGRHFPDTDKKWKNASSTKLLSKVVELAGKKGLKVSYIDAVVIIEKPKLMPFIGKMRKCIAKTGVPVNLINIKAKTNEGMGFIGKGQGAVAQAVCLLSHMVK